MLMLVLVLMLRAHFLLQRHSRSSESRFCCSGTLAPSETGAGESIVVSQIASNATTVNAGWYGEHRADVHEELEWWSSSLPFQTLQPFRYLELNLPDPSHLPK